MEKIKRIIFSIFILIVVLLIIIFAIKNKNNLKNGSMNIIEEEPDGYVHEMQSVKDANAFYTITKCIQSYLNNITINISIDDDIDDNIRKEMVFSLLSEKYVKEKNININNVMKYVNYVENASEFVPIKMNCLYEDKVTFFTVYGFLKDIETNEFLEEEYFIVTIGNTNSSFMIEPLINKEYNSIYDIPIDDSITSVKSNKYNYFTFTTVNINEMLEKYISFYKELSLTYPKLAYEYLEEEYRESRYGSLDEYIAYLNKNKNEIENIKLDKYLINTGEDYIEYVCKDQYNNLYIFKETATMQFTITLDTYTLENETFTTTYKSADTQNKVMMNIDKWIQMLNNRDYKTAYSVLDETFRTNNFGAVDNFEKYMREKYPDHYEMEFTNFTNKGQIYMQEVRLKSMEGNDDTILKINMKLNDELDFVMSFEI